MNDRSGKALRTAAIVLMGLTAAMNILGGSGTSCAAFFIRDFPPMWDLYDYQWLYQALVITTVPLGIAGVWATVMLARGRSSAYRNSVILLVIGTILGGIHMAASLALRGKALPANFKLYANAGTLLFFLLLQLPSLRNRVDWGSGASGDKTTAGGLAAIVAGGMALTTASWVGPSHFYQGINWVHLFIGPLTAAGAILVALGSALLMWVLTDVIRRELARAAHSKDPAQALVGEH